jgi:hypothetical protein
VGLLLRSIAVPLLRRLALSSSIALSLGAALVACANTEDKTSPKVVHDAGDASVDTEPLDQGFVVPDTTPDTHFDPDAACLRDSHAGVRLPPNILILFDRSASMQLCPDPSVTSCPAEDKWTQATTAIQQLLLTQPKDLRVGLKFFGTTDDSCTDADYARPDVALGPLSMTMTQINCWTGRASCAGISPPSFSMYTEMAPALRGAIAYMRAVKVDGQRLVILITDGDPTACDATNQVADVITAAANGFGGTPKIATYVIGVPGSTVQNLSQVAAAGGGKRVPTCIGGTLDPLNACHYQIGAGNVQADLQKALYDITNKARTCLFKIPPSTGDAATFDPGQVNVDLTAGGTTTELVRDVTHTNGWDYTDGNTTITIFGASCDTVLYDNTSLVDIVFGCPTKTPA